MKIIIDDNTFLKADYLWDFLMAEGVTAVIVRPDRYQYHFNNMIYSFTILEDRIFIPKKVRVTKLWGRNYPPIDMSNKYVQ